MYDDADDFEEGSGGFNPVAHLMRLAADPAGVIRRRWIWMLVVLVVGVAGSVAFVATMTPTYLAQSRVLISSQRIPEEFVRTTVRENYLEQMNAMVGKLLTQERLSKLIDTYGLFPGAEEKVPRSQLIAQLRGMIQVDREELVRSQGQDTSQIFTLSFEYPDAQIAAAVANELSSYFVETSIERRSRQARMTTEFLRKELQRAEAELREVNREISDFRRDHRGELPSDLAPALAKLERLSQQRQSLVTQISEVEDRILVLSGVKSEQQASESAAQLAELRRQLTAQLAVNTEEHPNVIAMREQIARLEKLVAEGEPIVTASDAGRQIQLAEARSQVQRLREQQAEIEREIRDTDARVDRIPGHDEALQALEGRAEVLQKTFLEYARKVQDAELAESLEVTQQGPQVTVLDRAQPPSQPTRQPVLFLAIGLLGSVAACLGIGLGLELIDPVVLDREQMAELFPEACIGAMPTL